MFLLKNIIKSSCSCCGMRAGCYTPCIPAELSDRPENIQIALVGEAPGQDEDAKGRPFIGRSGQLLRKLMDSTGLNKHPYAILSAVNCRPPGNKTPNLKTIRQCSPILNDRLKRLTNLKVIVALGKTAVRALTATEESLDLLRAKPLVWNNVPVLATYHPAAILRQREMLRLLFEDLQRAELLLKTQVLWISPEITVNEGWKELKDEGCLELSNREVSFDIETTGLQLNKDRVISASLSQGPNVATFFLKEKPGWEEMKQLLAVGNGETTIIGHNLVFDASMMKRNEGLDITNHTWFDTRIAYAVLYPEQRRNSLKIIGPVLTRISYPLTSAMVNEEYLGTGQYKDLMKYNALDTVITYRLYEILKAELIATDRMPVFNFVCELAKLASTMQANGIHINTDTLKKHHDDIQIKIENLKVDLTGKLREAFGFSMEKSHEWELLKIKTENKLAELREQRVSTKDKLLRGNLMDQIKQQQGILKEVRCLVKKSVECTPNSTAVVMEYLFGQDGLGLKAKRLTDKTGKPSMSEADLEVLPDDTGFIKKYLEMKGLEKFQSTYVKNLLTAADDHGMIYPHYNVVRGDSGGTVTGRITLTDPPIQTFPKEYLGFIDSRFGDKGKVIKADLSQVELRVVADVAGDEPMIEGYRSGADLHMATACSIFCKPAEEITPEMRRIAKTVNFGIVYGTTPNGMKENLKAKAGVDITFLEAKQFITRFYKAHPAIAEWQRQVVKDAARVGYGVSPIGRIRYFPDIDEDTPEGMSDKRAAINFPIQSGASDIASRGMYRLWQRTKHLPIYLVANIYDAILVDCPLEHLDFLKKTIKECFEDPDLMTDLGWKLKVPIRIDIE